jgi:hypothetical protein
VLVALCLPTINTGKNTDLKGFYENGRKIIELVGYVMPQVDVVSVRAT